MQFLLYAGKLTLLLEPCLLVSKRAPGPHLVKPWDFQCSQLIFSAAMASYDYEIYVLAGLDCVMTDNIESLTYHLVYSVFELHATLNLSAKTCIMSLLPIEGGG